MTAVDYRRFADRLHACAGRTERWSLLADVERDWGVHPVPSEIFSWTRRTPAPDVPAALTDWLGLPATSFTDEPQLYSVQLIHPPRDGVFLEHDEDRWSYRTADDDPPVFHSNGGESRLQSATLSEFVVHLALMRLPFWTGHSIWFPSTTPGDEARLDAASLPGLGLPPWLQAWGTEISGGRDVLVYRERGRSAWIVGRTPSAVRELGFTDGITAPEDRTESDPTGWERP